MMISTRTHLFMNSKASRQYDDSLGDFGQEGKEKEKEKGKEKEKWKENGKEKEKAKEKEKEKAVVGLSALLIEIRCVSKFVCQISNKPFVLRSIICFLVVEDGRCSIMLYPVGGVIIQGGVKLPKDNYPWYLLISMTTNPSYISMDCH